MTRIFVYDDREFPDPDPQMSVEQVKNTLSDFYGEIANASVKDGRATIGVQQPSSDPHIESFDDPDLSELSQEVSAVIERARVKWEETPKYPAHERPAPPAKRRTRREQRSAQASTAVEGESDQQQPEALRLFQEPDLAWAGSASSGRAGGRHQDGYLPRATGRMRRPPLHFSLKAGEAGPGSGGGKSASRRGQVQIWGRDER